MKEIKLELLKKELVSKSLRKLTELGRENKVDICFDAEEADRLKFIFIYF
jgi:RHH-type proline utilization regulon transcriptional repressor/proline dehydrogenase/delta 1-pyrroline-5-carboxylate dehydrogenase